MQSKYDPFDLKISVSPHGGIEIALLDDFLEQLLVDALVGRGGSVGVDLAGGTQGVVHPASELRHREAVTSSVAEEVVDCDGAAPDRP